MPLVRPATPDDLDAAHACYRRNEYMGCIQPADDVLVAEHDGDIVGVVRLAHEEGHQLLRGMFVDEAHRGQGLGSRMITRLAERMADDVCWLIAGPHLVRFYGQIGFRLTEDAEAPAHMQERVASYRDTYGPQCLLRRSPPSLARDDRP